MASFLLKICPFHCDIYAKYTDVFGFPSAPSGESCSSPDRHRKVNCKDLKTGPTRTMLGFSHRQVRLKRATRRGAGSGGLISP